MTARGPRLMDVLAQPTFTSSRTETTLWNYGVALRRWRAYAGVDRVGDVTPEAARAFVAARMATCKAQSVAVEFMAVLAVLDHLERAGQFDLEWLRQLRRLVPALPRRKELHAPFLTHAEVERAVAGAPHDRARFGIRLLTLTGLRAGEAASLLWSDVDVGARSLVVRGGKTGGRRVPLARAAIEVLQDARPTDTSGSVLGDVHRRSLQHWCARTSELSGVKITPVLCRHTRASWWVAAGVPLAKVARWLGHSVFVCARYYAGLADNYDPDVERGAC